MDYDKLMKEFAVYIHPEGYPAIFVAAFVTCFLSLFSGTLAFLSFVVTCFCIGFFRNPARVTPVHDGFVISPADGCITTINENVALPKELELKEEGEKFTRISIFLSLLDVHVNRLPINGSMEKGVYVPGSFMNASLDKSSEYNERHISLLRDVQGKYFAVTQIAGLVPRRIVCNLKVGDECIVGERFGIIKFGSRVDIYLPSEYSLRVTVGQRMVGGETVLAELGDVGDIAFKKV